MTSALVTNWPDVAMTLGLPTLVFLFWVLMEHGWPWKRGGKDDE